MSPAWTARGRRSANLVGPTGSAGSGRRREARCGIARIDTFTSRFITGNAKEVLRGLPNESVDLIATDPPYGLSVMGATISGCVLPDRLQRWLSRTRQGEHLPIAVDALEAMQAAILEGEV